MTETSIEIRPNTKTRVENFEITCYGERTIMVDHPRFSAPRPIGPTEDSAFWDESDEYRLLEIIKFIDNSIDWDESNLMAISDIVGDIGAIRDRYEDTDYSEDDDD